MNTMKILVGVTGGVAAYKALDLVSALRKRGHAVRVVMTDAATEFVRPAAFAAVSGQPVLLNMWPDPAATSSLERRYPHLYPATETDLFVLVPATANTIAKIAHGFGSDLLSTCALSLPAHCRKVFCPAMNVEMWNNPMVIRNARRLEELGWVRLGPESGHLACGMVGEGRLRLPDAILSDLESLTRGGRPLEGRRVLILSGPTREHLDPIRFIGNPSSGIMGKALAEEACLRGAEVDFVTGPVPDDHLPTRPGVISHRVTGALEMLEAARGHLARADAAIYVAAVADYRPETVLDRKMPKRSEAFNLRLVPNPDLAATLNAQKRPETFTIGFALQTREGENQARKKLKAKGLDGIVLNYPDSMGAAAGRFSYLSAAADDFIDWGTLGKSEAARRILDQLPQPEPPAHG